MSRLAAVAILLLVSGCTWDWHSLQPADGGGPDAGGGDAGPAPSCQSGDPCAEPSLCVRGITGGTPPCCFADLCLPRQTRPLGWAREITTGGGWPSTRSDAMDGEPHWGTGTPVYPLTSVISAAGAPAAGDGRAEVRVAWSWVGLMLFVHVEDDRVERGPGPGSDGVDAIEIRLDVLPTSPGAPDAIFAGDEETRVTIALRDGSPADVEAIFDGRTWDQTEVYLRETASGFDLEMGFNWVDLASIAPIAGEAVGLDVRFLDRDGDGTEHVHSWTDCARPVGEGLGLVVLAPSVGPSPPTRCGRVCEGSELCAPDDYPCDPDSPTVCAP